MKIKNPFILIVIFGIVINFFCFLLFGFTSHAEDTYSNTLPFYFTGVDNYNSFLNDDLLNYIDSQNLPVYDPDYVLICRDIGFQGSSVSGSTRYYNYRFYFDLLPFSSVDNYVEDIYSNPVQFTLNTDLPIYRFYVGVPHVLSNGSLVPSFYGIGGLTSNFTPTLTIFGHAPYVYDTGYSESTKPNWTFSAFYPGYFSKDFAYNDKIVLSFSGGSSIINTGVAIIPPAPIIPDFDNLTPPSKVPPTFTPSDYQWTTPPSFDGSSVEAALGSIQNIIGWLSNNLKEEFKNLTDNLEGFFKYIGETIQYYGGLIIDSLNNFIQNFYDNMKALVEPIVQKLEYFTEPLDKDQVQAALESTSFYSLVSVGTTFKNTFVNYFDSISVPSSLSFHIPYRILTKQGYIDFDFAWYNDIKNSVLPWIVGFLYAGVGLALFRCIPSLINGVSGVLQKGA